MVMGNDSNCGRVKEIILLNDKIHLKGTPYVHEYFPDDFVKFLTFSTKGELKDSNEQIRKWYSDYLDL